MATSSANALVSRHPGPEYRFIEPFAGPKWRASIGEAMVPAVTKMAQKVADLIFVAVEITRLL